MPIRELLAHDDLRLACRTFRFGDPAELIMVETRLSGRDEALDYEGRLEWQDGQPVIAPFLEKLNDPGRQMLGPWQERWLGDTLAQSTSDGERWQVLATRLSWHAWPPRPQESDAARAMAVDAGKCGFLAPSCRTQRCHVRV